jgi:hypothetical protein
LHWLIGTPLPAGRVSQTRYGVTAEYEPGTGAVVADSVCAVGAVTAGGRAAAAGCDSENEKTMAAVAATAPMARVCLPLIVDLLNLPRECPRTGQPDIANATRMARRTQEDSICDLPLRGAAPP